MSTIKERYDLLLDLHMGLRAENARLREQAEALAAALNQAYRERNELAAAMAPRFDGWVGHDPAEPDWPVLYLQLPTGQVSYHFSPEDAALLEGVREGLSFERWDGHSQEERSRRLWLTSRAAALRAYREPAAQPEGDDEYGMVKDAEQVADHLPPGWKLWAWRSVSASEATQ